LDIFRNGAVVMEKHVCVSSYLFYCNGMASFTYEVGAERERTTGGHVSGNTVKYNTEKYTEWVPMGGTTNAAASVIAPGNRNYGEVIKNVYGYYDANRLTDVEDLVLPTDVETHGFNLPQPAAFNEFAKPRVEGLLLESAQNSLRGKNYRALTLGGCSVQKDEVLRLSLGMYQLAFQYRGKIHTLFLSGDGAGYWWDVQPIDQERLAYYNEQCATVEKLKKSPFVTLAVVCAIAGLFTSGITLLGTALFGFLHFKRKKECKAAQEELEAFIAEARNNKQQFLRSGNFIKGIG
jgi:hypothetical protein